MTTGPQLDAVSRLLGAGVVVLDAAGRATWVSESFATFTGFPNSEFIGRCPGEVLCPPEFGPNPCEAVLEAISAGRHFSGRIRARRANGDILWLDVRGCSLGADSTPVPSASPGDGGVYLTLHTDVTAEVREGARREENAKRLREAQDALAESRGRLQNVLGKIDMLAIALDPAGRLTYANRYARELLSSGGGELVGRAWAEFATQDDPLTPLAHVAGTGGLSNSQLEAELRDARGEPRSVRWHVTTAARGSDGAAGLFCLGADVTDRRLALNRARERDDRVRHAQNHAQKMEALGRLAGGIAHDVNNLLTVITSAGSQLREAAPRGSPAFELSDELLHAATRGAEMMRQLLAFSRRQVVAPRPIDLNKVLASVAKMMRRLLDPSVELVADLDPALPSVMADPGQIEQVVVNLALNARDAMSRGGQLVLGSRRARVPVAAGPAVELWVRDTGHGMTEAVKAHLFEPFFTTKPDGTGTGLGLATSFGIVEQFGGRIMVDSEPGRGTEVVVALPIAGTPCEPVQSSTEKVPLDGSGEVILFVEDEPLVRRAVARILRSLGYEVLVAEGADQAEQLAAAAERLDALVTDIVMPGRSGHELALCLRASRPDLPVVYMSGHAADDGVRRALSAQPECFLDKPFQPHALAATLRAVLARPKPPGALLSSA